MRSRLRAACRSSCGSTCNSTALACVGGYCELALADAGTSSGGTSGGPADTGADGPPGSSSSSSGATCTIEEAKLGPACLIGGSKSFCNPGEQCCTSSQGTSSCEKSCPTGQSVWRCEVGGTHQCGGTADSRCCFSGTIVDGGGLTEAGACTTELVDAAAECRSGTCRAKGEYPGCAFDQQCTPGYVCKPMRVRTNSGVELVVGHCVSAS